MEKKTKREKTAPKLRTFNQRLAESVNKGCKLLDVPPSHRTLADFRNFASHVIPILDGLTGSREELREYAVILRKVLAGAVDKRVKWSGGLANLETLAQACVMRRVGADTFLIPGKTREDEDFIQKCVKKLESGEAARPDRDAFSRNIRWTQFLLCEYYRDNRLFEGFNVKGGGKTGGPVAHLNASGLRRLHRALTDLVDARLEDAERFFEEMGWCEIIADLEAAFANLNTALPRRVTKICEPQPEPEEFRTKTLAETEARGAASSESDTTRRNRVQRIRTFEPMDGEKRRSLTAALKAGSRAINKARKLCGQNTSISENVHEEDRFAISEALKAATEAMKAALTINGPEPAQAWRAAKHLKHVKSLLVREDRRAVVLALEDAANALEMALIIRERKRVLGGACPGFGEALEKASAEACFPGKGGQSVANARNARARHEAILGHEFLRQIIDALAVREWSESVKTSVGMVAKELVALIGSAGPPPVNSTAEKKVCKDALEIASFVRMYHAQFHYDSVMPLRDFRPSCSGLGQNIEKFHLTTNATDERNPKPAACRGLDLYVAQHFPAGEVQPTLTTLITYLKLHKQRLRMEVEVALEHLLVVDIAVQSPFRSYVLRNHPKASPKEVSDLLAEAVDCAEEQLKSLREMGDNWPVLGKMGRRPDKDRDQFEVALNSVLRTRRAEYLKNRKT